MAILCLLAGGRSSRFGSAKAALNVAGLPVLRWQRERLQAGLPDWSCWLSLAPGATLPGSAGFERIIVDPLPFPGPLAAMAAVLEACPQDELVAFLPVDMLLVTPALIARLQRSLLEQPHLAGVLGRWAAGPRLGAIEPLPSVWRSGAGRQLLQDALAAGVRGPRQLADWPAVATLPLGQQEEQQYWGINCPEDLPRVAAALGCVVCA